MSIVSACPACGRKLHAPEHLAGRKARCPKCGHKFLVSDSKRITAAPEQDAFTAAAPQITPVQRKLPLHDGFDFIEEDDSEGAANPPAKEACPLPAVGSRVPLSLGIASLLLGCAALVLGLVPYAVHALPFVSMVSIVMAVLGMLLGLGSVQMALVRKGHGLGLPFAGSACNLVALGTAALWLLWLSKAPQQASATQPGKTPLMAKNSPGPAPADRDNGNRAKSSDAKEPKWLDASKGPVAHGDLQVQVSMVIVGTVKIKDVLGDQTETQQKYLGIQIFVGNASKTKKIDYRGWSGAVNAASLTDALKGLGRDGSGLADVMAAGGKNAAILTDSFGNAYKRFALELGAEIPGQIHAETSIYPEKSVEDLLVFEPPLENAEYLHLELPASATGGTGSIYLQIPRSMIRR